MPILHQGIDRIVGESARARCPFGDKPAVRIRERAIGSVAAALAAEVDRPVPRILGTDRVPPIVGAQAPRVLLGIEGLFQGDKTLIAGVRPDQGAIGTHAATHQAFGQRSLRRVIGHPLQQAGLVKPPASVLAEGRGVPRLLVEIRAAPTSAGPCCHAAPSRACARWSRRLALAGHAEQIAADQGQEQLLQWDRGTADRGVQVSAGPPDSALIMSTSHVAAYDAGSTIEVKLRNAFVITLLVAEDSSLT